MVSFDSVPLCGNFTHSIFVSRGAFIKQETFELQLQESSPIVGQTKVSIAAT